MPATFRMSFLLFLFLGALRTFSIPALIHAEETATVAEAATPSLAIDEAQIRKHVEYLASEELAGRGFKGGRIAGDYIQNHFAELELEPLFSDSYFQDVPGAKVNGKQLSGPGRNVGAILVGSDPQLKDEIIIIGAHYDHLGQNSTGFFPGADDNASGTSMLLEVARVIKTSGIKPRRSIAFVAFDLEERLLWGSRWFVAHPPRPLENFKCLLVADMIGRSLGDLELNTVFVLGSEHGAGLPQLLDRTKSPEGLHIARLGIDLIGIRSDYGPFWDQQIPFLFFSSGEHPDYHQQTDLPEKVLFKQVTKVSQLVHDLSLDLASGDEPPLWVEEVTPTLEEVRTVRKIAEMLLAQKEKRKFGATQLLLLGHVKSKTQQILDSGEISEGERTWLMRISQILIFSVL